MENLELGAVTPSGQKNWQANRERILRWLPRLATGELIGAIAMTEPGTGSDLQNIKAKAIREGDHYVINGAKTFITGGVHADRVIVCARTSPSSAEDRRFGISLLVVDTKSPGYAVGRKLDNIMILRGQGQARHLAAQLVLLRPRQRALPAALQLLHHTLGGIGLQRRVRGLVQRQAGGDLLRAKPAQRRLQGCVARGRAAWSGTT